MLRRTSVVPRIGSSQPHAVREFQDERVAWLIEREVLRRAIDVVQIEYTNMGQYILPRCRNIVWILFEHDIYFQSVRSSLRYWRGVSRAKAFLEYLRALRFELHRL